MSANAASDGGGAKAPNASDSSKTSVESPTKNGTDDNVATANTEAAADSPDTDGAKPDHVEHLQYLVTHHVDLFERLLYVERDINNQDNFTRLHGDESAGLLTRRTKDKRRMEVDWHAKFAEQALDKSGTRDQIKLQAYAEGTGVRGNAHSVQLMVEALSQTIFDSFIDNADEVLTTLGKVEHAVSGKNESVWCLLPVFCLRRISSPLV